MAALPSILDWTLHFWFESERPTAGATINEGWVSRKTDEYSSTDIDQDEELDQTLLNEYFRLP